MLYQIEGIYILIVFISIFFQIKCNYAIFELNTYKNESKNENELIKYFYETFTNILYSEISLGSKGIQYIMELKIDSIGLTIYNYNCDIPPLNKYNIPPFLPNFADSIVLDHVDDNLTEINGEYFIYILNNNINIKTSSHQENVVIDYLFSQRNDTKYIKKELLRPYTCFNLGFHLPTKKVIEDEYALNLIFQLKKKDIIHSYNWFIEYDSNNKEKAKLILGAKPYEYNKDKYNEKNEKTIQAEKRLDNEIYWDIKMSEIYVMENKEKVILKGYDTCSLEPSLGVIIGVSGYKNYVEEKLFNPLISQGKCFKEKNIYDKFIIYYCNKDMKDILKKSEAVKLFFNQRFFGKTFQLNFNDLFEEKGNYIFFKIFFDDKNSDIWRLGKPFLVKYFFSYNFDGKTISYYYLEKEEKDEKNIDNKSRNILIIMIVLLATIFLVLGFFLGRYLFLL